MKINKDKLALAFIFGIMLTAGVFAVTTIDDAGIKSGGDITLPTGNRLILSSNNDGTGDDSAITLYQQTGESKPFLLWYDNFTTPNTPVVTGWFGCHYNNTAGNHHQHCSWESIDTDVGYAESKLVMSYGTPRASSYLLSTNVEFHRFGAGVDVRIASGDIINEDSWLGIFVNNQTDASFRIQNNTDAMTLSANGLEYVEIPNKVRIGGSSGNGEVIIAANTSARSCSASKAGSIYFDTDTDKHYGCDGSAWNALY